MRPETPAPDTAPAEWGRQSRAAAGPQPMPELPAGPRRPRHFGWQLAAGALAVAVAAALAVAVPRWLGTSGTADPLRGITSTASAAPGFQVVTFHGLSITVPASWQVHDGRYCQLSVSVIELPADAEDACGRGDYPELTIVDLFGASGPLPQLAVRSTGQTTISGLPATRADGSVGSRAAFSLSIPRLSVSVLIEPAEGQAGADLAASLRVDAADVHGCPARIAGADAFPPPASSGRPGTAGALIPGRPSSMTGCRYVDGWLNQGSTVSGTALHTFTDTVNALPAGLSRTADLGLFQCPGSPHVSGGVPAPGEPDSYRLELHYPDGPPVLLTARVGFCGELGISNGSRTGQLTEALQQLLAGTVGSLGIAPGQTKPVR